MSDAPSALAVTMLHTLAIGAGVGVSFARNGGHERGLFMSLAIGWAA